MFPVPWSLYFQEEYSKQGGWRLLRHATMRHILNMSRWMAEHSSGDLGDPGPWSAWPVLLAIRAGPGPGPGLGGTKKDEYLFCSKTVFTKFER